MDYFEYFWEVLVGESQPQIIRIVDSCKENSYKILLDLYPQGGKLIEIRRIIG